MAFRLLHVLPTLDIRSGGPLRLVIDLAERSRRFGLESEVVGTGNYHLPDCTLAPARIHWCPGALLGTYSYSPELRDWLRRNLGRFEGVLIHGAWSFAALASARECQRQRVPYAVFPHGMLEAWAVNGQGRWKSWKKHLYWRTWEHRIYEAARCVFFATRREQQRSQAVFPLPPHQLVLPVYGIESDMPPAPEPENSALARPRAERWVLSLGRVHPKKNIDLLIQAWSLARPADPWRLLIVGPAEPHYRSVLEQLVRRRRLEGQVRFVGLVSGTDKAYLFQQSEWFLLPSKQENFGVAVLEAIAHHCPVVLSDQVFVAESFPADAEILPLDITAWVEFFAERMTDASWRRTRIETDRKHLLERFGMDRVARDWAEIVPRCLRG